MSDVLIPFPTVPFRPDVVTDVQRLVMAALREVGVSMKVDGPYVGLTKESIRAQEIAYVSLSIEHEFVEPHDYKERCMAAIAEHGWQKGFVTLMSHTWDAEMRARGLIPVRRRWQGEQC